MPEFKDYSVTHISYEVYPKTIHLYFAKPLYVSHSPSLFRNSDSLCGQM